MPGGEEDFDGFNQDEKGSYFATETKPITVIGNDILLFSRWPSGPSSIEMLFPQERTIVTLVVEWSKAHAYVRTGAVKKIC